MTLRTITVLCCVALAGCSASGTTSVVAAAGTTTTASATIAAPADATTLPVTTTVPAPSSTAAPTTTVAPTTTEASADASSPSDAFCNDLRAGFTPMQIWQGVRDQYTLKEFADLAYGFAAISCPEQLVDNDPLRAFLTNWDIDPDA